MPDRFNIALRPSSPNFARQTIALAEEGFANLADGYLLGREAWPHVTLCQFRGPKPAVWMDKIWGDLGNTTLDLQFTGYYLRESKKKESNAQYVGLQVQRNPKLITLQKRAHDLAKELKLEVLTDTGDSYFPHLTFARIGKSAGQPELKSLPPEILMNRSPFYLTIGAAGPHGTYISELLPALQE